MFKRKLLLGLAAAVFASAVFGQSAIVRGEVSAGVYENIKSIGNALVVGTGATSASAVDTSGNATLNIISGYNWLSNGTTWDRQRNVTGVNAGGGASTGFSLANAQIGSFGEVTWLTSAARTSTQTLADTVSAFAKGILVQCNVTVAPGVETLILAIQRKDSLSSSYITLAANTATTATGMIVVKVYPTFTAVAASATGQTANDTLGITWRLLMTHSAAGSWTYSCSYQLLG